MALLGLMAFALQFSLPLFCHVEAAHHRSPQFHDPHEGHGAHATLQDEVVIRPAAGQIPEVPDGERYSEYECPVCTLAKSTAALYPPIGAPLRLDADVDSRPFPTAADRPSCTTAS